MKTTAKGSSSPAPFNVSEHKRIKDGGKTPLRARFKNRPVRGPSLQWGQNRRVSCRPRALTLRFRGLLKHALSKIENHMSISLSLFPLQFLDPFLERGLVWRDFL